MMEFDRTLVRLMTGEINAMNEVFYDHKVHAGVVPADSHITPAFLQYRITLGRGVRVSKVTGLERELTDALSRYRKHNISVRLTETPLLLEVPHPDPQPIRYLESGAMLKAHEMLVGQSYNDQSIQNVVIDFQQTPHMLIAATTGEGKSVCMTVGILSLCEHQSPDNLMLHLIDLKNDDLVALEKLPHVDACAGTEEKAIKLLGKLNQLKEARINGDDKSVRHMLFIDELAELVRNPTAMKLLESMLAMGRSLNINIVAATQHPLSNVIGSLIKANFPTRLIGKVMGNEASKVASGMSKLGAELLPGKGSFILVEGGRIVRLQGYFVSPQDAADVVLSLRNRYAVEGEEGRTGERLSKTLTHYQRLQQMEAGTEGEVTADVLEFAARPEVIEVFERFYDRDSGEMRYGWQANMVRTIFGHNANKGGWNRKKALDVMEYLRNHPPLSDGKFGSHAKAA